jgi:hypothetical protein
MPRALRKQAVAVVLPALYMDTGIAPSRPVDPRPRICVTRQTRAQVIDRKIHGFRQSRQARRVGQVTIGVTS